MPADVVVVGAGISGLTAAYRLSAAGANVTVLESTERIGGKLRTVELAGRPFDVGAEAFLARRPEAMALASSVGLPVVHPSGARASIRAGGTLRPIPPGTVMGIPGSVDSAREVLSDNGLRTLAAEPSLPRVAHADDVSVGKLIRERLGAEVADRLVDPLLGGVYAGRADDLGLAATMPALAKALGEKGSVLRAAASLVPANPSKSPVFGAVAGGYRELVEALNIEALNIDVRTRTTVNSLRRNGNRWRLGLGSANLSDTIDADAVLLAVPAPAAAKLLADVAPTASIAYGEIELASMAVVGMALPGDVELPHRSGILLASGERHADGKPFSAKAFTFSSRKWTHLGAGMLRASVGRFGDTGTLRRGDADLVAAVRADLAELTGITAQPVDTVVQRWGGGLPQYGVGHPERVRRIEATLPAGIAVAGAALHGVGVAPCIATATAAADRLMT
jgi:oxygen-dependent protoporphyrinogen oxidase